MSNLEAGNPSPNGNQAAQTHFLLLDNQLRVTDASNSFYSAFQTAPSETLGRNLADLGNGQWSTPDFLKLLADLPASGVNRDFDMGSDSPLLTGRPMSLHARRLALPEDAHTGMILLSIDDFSAQKPSGEETDESPARLRGVLEGMGDAVIVTDPQSRIVFLNHAAERLTGWRRKHALQRHLPDILQLLNEQLIGVESPVEKVIRAGEAGSVFGHAVLLARDGSQCPIDNSAGPILDLAGRITGFVVVFRDVASRRNAEQELEFSELRYRRLFEAAHDGILILDAVSAKVLDVNPFLAALLGYTREHFIGKELWEIGVFDDAASSKVAMDQLQRLGHIRYENRPLQHRDGRQIPVEFVSNVYREGTRTVIQCNIRDITDRKHLSEELLQASAAVAAANKAKSEFLANMSHEIRTPMTAILGFAEMLLNKKPEECAEIGCVQIIRRNALHLLELINDILDLSKVEAGQMKVECIPCDLLALLSEIASLMRPRAQEKGLTFEIQFQGPIPRLIQSDPVRLRQILINLIGNAMKFTESGKIELRIMEEEPADPNIMLRVEVIDSGIGMSAEQLARLFRPFTQADTSITRKFGGTGLGLTISRQLAMLLGGDVTATSEPRSGSTFALTVNGGPSAGVERLLDLTESTLPKRLEHGGKAEIYLRGRILLVEDGADNQRLLRMQLSGAGGSVVSALNGQIAVDLATSQPFDLILMDMQMPVLDGYHATRELRRRGVTIPIIALTAYAMAEDRDKCVASGCDGYLSKPVDEETLLSTVNQYLGRRVPTNSVPAYSPIRSSLAGDPRMMKIIPEFVARLPGKVDKMLDLLEHHDLVALLGVVHDLVGTAGGYGFAPVTQPARQAQDSIRAGAALEPIAAEINSLIAVIRRIEGYDDSNASPH
jgi:PAS domain S-box-containing protein